MVKHDRPDIDIDLADRDQLLALITHTPARMSNGRRHNTGIYVTDIPWDPKAGCAAIEYEKAAELGYSKLDLLNMTVYRHIRDQQHYQQLLDREPTWARAWEDPQWAANIVHIGGYTDLLATMKPNSIVRMAAFISIIRPGKAHLQGKPWAEVFASVWDGDDSLGYIFRKSHAISYAALVALHMNILEEIKASSEPV